MLNNGPSVAGLYIASAAPTNISTVEFKCPLTHSFSLGTDSPFHNKKQKQTKKNRITIITTFCAISGRN